MARSAAVVADWNAFRRHRFDDELELWTGFSLEIDGSNIVAPHLYAIGGRPGYRLHESRACTIAKPPRFAVFAHRTVVHREYLLDDVVPRLAPVCPHIAIVDSAARTFEAVGDGARQPLAALTATLDRWAESVTFAGLDLEARLDDYEQFFGRETHQVDAETANRVEAAPLRLWEALFARGHAYRYELIDGEVVEIADLGTQLATNRTLMQCVRDAERLCRAAPVEERGWIRVGRFRFRERATLLEIRVGLSPADIRVAFAPHALGTGAGDLPGLVGVLVAGGDNGKTELMNGYTWASVRCTDDRELLELADKVSSEIGAWTGAPVQRATDLAEYPGHRDGTWVVEARPGKHPLLVVFVPMYRDDLLPWRAIT